MGGWQRPTVGGVYEGAAGPRVAAEVDGGAVGLVGGVWMWMWMW